MNKKLELRMIKVETELRLLRERMNTPRKQVGNRKKVFPNEA